MKTIDRAVAKGELARINAVLPVPHLLIGGLAVQQYHTARDSKDIDLVCEFKTSRDLLEKLYPSIDWKVEDLQEDEYRPSFQIRHRVEDLGTIFFGPKISERTPYNHINWELLAHDARPFRGIDNVELAKILVPTAHTLAYTKFISFLGRKSSGQKIETDLKDFVDLTNHSDFSASDFYALLRKTGSFNDLCASFRVKCENYRSIINGSCLYGLSSVFTPLRGDHMDSTITVWIIGSVNDLSSEHGALAFKVADSLADAFVTHRYRVVMGRNTLLDYFADRVASDQLKPPEPNVRDVEDYLSRKSVRAVGLCPNPLIILGSLRPADDLGSFFVNAIGRVPDIGILIGGSPGGRAQQEALLASQAKIPLLPIPHTGGNAAATSASFDASLHEKVRAVQAMLRGSDVISLQVCELIEAQVSLSRNRR